ncbi:hypothetical protein [Halosimplex amylolyticum]|uniref:hypothetical protein n=1 Tax=Halosimplex amylolyticum TaxID=3396616 RepID=UPI003F57ADC9
MQRRSVLRGLAALTAGAAVAGCTGANREVPVAAPEPPDGVRNSGGDGDAGIGSDGSAGAGDGTADTPQFAVPEWTYEATEGGDLLVVLTVENRSQVPHETTMMVVLTAGNKRFTPTEHVALQSGASTEVRIVVPVPYSEYDADPGFEVQFEPGGPATPIPEGTVTPYPEDRETATAGSTDASGSSGTDESTTGRDSAETTETDSAETDSSGTNSTAPE